MKDALSTWEPYGRSLVRIFLAFTFSLHGFRHALGVFAVSGGRRAASPMALDGLHLSALMGCVEIALAVLLLLGLFTRAVAILLSFELFAAYLYSAAPRGAWPIRNGGNETLVYLLVFVYLAVAGAGLWSLDRLRGARPEPARS